MRAMLLILVLTTTVLAPWVSAQKVRVGYDKSVDFAGFKTYTWVEPSTSPQRPLLYSTVVSSVDYELQTKGLHRVSRDGDLTLLPEGGVDFGLMASSGSNLPSGPPPAINSTMWTGPWGPANGTEYSSEGTLTITLVERASNRQVWVGSVTQNLDPENKEQSLQLAQKAVAKLFRQFPPKKK